MFNGGSCRGAIFHPIDKLKLSWMDPNKYEINQNGKSIEFLGL